jgi:hypothetical protein
MRQTSRLGLRRGVTAVAAVLCLLAAQASGATPTLAFSARFTLAAGFQYDLGAGTSALGPDGTVWLAQPLSPSAGFEIVARTADGHALRPGIAPGRSGSAYSRPEIATAAGAATFVWETASDAGGPNGTAAVKALRCTLRGCAPLQTLATWRWTYGNDSFPPMGYQAQPEVASAGGETVAVFLRDAAANPQMTWAQAGAGRFGAPHSFGAGGAGDPVLVSEAGGRILAAWLAGSGDAASGSGVTWASWSARAGFTRVKTLAGASGDYAAGLVGTRAAGGAALAWIQGDNNTDPGLAAEPVWVARQNSTRFSKPVRAFAGFAFGLSLASADGVLALGFTTTARAGLDGDSAGPAMVVRSDGGKPFSRPVTFDPEAAPTPAVAVAADGDVLAAWNDNGAKAAIATATGAFGPPLEIGAEMGEDSPVIRVGGCRALVLWEGPSATGAVFAAFAAAVGGSGRPGRPTCR